MNLNIDNLPPEAHYTVYKLTDPEGKVYIGCTGTPVKKRWNEGKNYQSTSPIRKAIDKFGWENLSREILCERLAKEGAEKLEQWFIANYDSSDPKKGYNCTLGGLGKGVRLTKETKRSFSRCKKQLYAERPELKEKIRNAMNSLYEKDPSFRERVSLGFLAAYEKDPKLKDRLRENTKELWKNPNYREKTTKGRIVFCESNAAYSLKQRRIQKEYLQANPEIREEARQRMREYLSKPENRVFVESDSRAKPVICVETGEWFPSQNAAEKATGFCSIHKVCKGQRNVCGGYHWRYAKEK